MGRQLSASLSANGRDISRKHVVPSPGLLFMYRCALADFHSRIHKYDRAAVRCTLVEVLSCASASGDTGCTYLEGWQAWRMSANAGQGATCLLRTMSAPRRDMPAPGRIFCRGSQSFTFADLHESNYETLFFRCERERERFADYSAIPCAVKPQDVLTTDTESNGEKLF